MARSRIHVRRDRISKDNRSGKVSYALGVETQGRAKRYGTRVEILGMSEVIYRPNKPLSCGAKAWIETYSTVIVHRR
jgi:hypothetical protein